MSTNISELNALIARMTEGDRARLLSFARAIIETKAGKKQSRRQSFSDRRPVVDSWKVGEV